MLKTSPSFPSLITNKNPYRVGQIVKMILHVPDFSQDCITKNDILTPTKFDVLLSPPLRVVSVDKGQVNASLCMLGKSSPVITHMGNASQFIPIC